jgi:hypothetical protein
LHFCFWFRQLAVLAKPRTKAIRSAVTPRLKKEVPEGQRDKLSIGTLFLPKGVKGAGKMPLFIHFHGGDWLPEAAARDHANTAVLSVQLGSGSAVYAKPFADAKSFGNLLAEAEKKRFIVTHTQIVPPGYASNTETADYLLHHLKLERKESKKIGPMQTQQLSEARAGHFVLLGYEGDTAADHVDLLHALPYYLKLVHAVE